MRLPGDEVRQVQAGKRRAMIFPLRGRVAYEAGRSYPIFNANAPEDDEAEPKPDARIVVTNVEVTELHAVDYRTMQQAGFKYREDLHEYWSERHVDPGPPDKPKRIPVIVVRFQLDRTAVRRYMLDGPRGGYAELADDEVPRGVMRDEPESVPESWQNNLSLIARRRDLEEAQKRRDAPKTMPLPERLTLAMKQAEAGGVDISRQLGIIGKRIEAVERIVFDAT